jgi:hypothetical protein
MIGGQSQEAPERASSEAGSRPARRPDRRQRRQEREASVATSGVRVGIGPGRVTRAERAGTPPVDVTARTPLGPRLIAEVRDLHDRNVALSREAGGPRGRRGRRQRREARDAENDMLRVLGFPSYEAFLTHVDGPPPVHAALTSGTGMTLSLVEEPPAATASSAATELDAEETEAALLRILHGERRGTAPVPVDEPSIAEDEVPRLPPPGGLADLHARIAYFEEELAETRFELGRMRDRLCKAPDPDPDEAEGANPIPAAAEALVQAAAELRCLCELLRTERAEIAALGGNARAQAEQILEAARLDAQLLREEAATAARAVLDQASADAIALTRNAISTVEGLRRLAGEDQGRADGAP